MTSHDTAAAGAGAAPTPVGTGTGVTAFADLLDQPLTRYVPGNSPRSTVALLEKELGITTVGQLLDHSPRRYIRRGKIQALTELVAGERTSFVARVESSSTRRMRSDPRRSLTDVTVADDTGASLKITFFNAYSAQKDLPVGSLALFTGKPEFYRGTLSMAGADYAPVEAPESLERSEDGELLPIPVYPETAKLTTPRIAKVVHQVLVTADLDSLADPLPPEVVAAEKLVPPGQAYRDLHRPESVAAYEAAQRRFRFQEAFVLQTELRRRRAEHAAHPVAPRPVVEDGLLARFDASLPFELTPRQREVGEQISAELAGTAPMNRLLQGDVGSGKTVVALRAMLQIVDAGGQAAMLAPTEVLATQHHEKITRALGPLAMPGRLGGDDHATEVTLLTGSMGATARRKALLDIASGAAGIVVGTHALIQEAVQFADLGLAVVDEQHRFGVEQRDALRDKAGTSPHTLVMTATPIPRTVAMTVFGDLDVSTLRELPGGRQPIETHVVGLAEHGPAWERRVWQLAAEHIANGHQVYVVAPKIGDDAAVPSFTSLRESLEADPEEPEPATVAWLEELVTARPELRGARVGVLHGRQDAQVKARTMADVAAGTVDVLVATTVIEVGVDVPNATLMVVVDPERFGISQLHQLRGRIGRGEHASTCLLVTRTLPEHPARTRLDAVAATTDGFELAEVDLRLRKEGDILGASQSGGRSGLRWVGVLRDEALVARARTAAEAVITEDPQLTAHPDLRVAIGRVLDEDRQAFLERG
ncbi:ATP-dependent DNA helicase RecG [Kocuria varians]|uniref:Probable DNA 3'-5' helicase RecG n=1 Tax=Kocuria varians TaxID=1272 RepID=A0A4Y4DAL9_KOCVA|nr:ATP-dependent DNA helicase RecG [Kocuria varians]GEC99790.1 ATP-dependent DNA helicase RecG [Kocuria varians]